MHTRSYIARGGGPEHRCDRCGKTISPGERYILTIARNRIRSCDHDVCPEPQVESS